MSNTSWYNEENVKRVLANHLKREGYEVRISKPRNETGRDIEAKRGEKLLWIEVKGVSDKSRPTQARHRIEEGLLQIICNRDENKDVELALALPDGPRGFKTYHKLIEKIKWFKEMASFKIIWVSEDESVRIE